MTANVVAFTVPGQPQGKGRARVGRVNGQARMFTPAKTVAYESLVALAAKHVMRGAAPFAGPVAVEIEAVHAVPASWSKKRRQRALDGLDAPSCKPDLDNVIKSIGDGANGVVWLDDRQISAVQAVRKYGETPGVHVRVAALEALA